MRFLEVPLTYFIISQLDFIKQAIVSLFSFIERKQNEQQQALNLLTSYLSAGKLNSRQAILIQHALKHSGELYTIEAHKNLQHISQYTARNDLIKLAELGLLQQSKRGKVLVFMATADLAQRIKKHQ